MAGMNLKSLVDKITAVMHNSSAALTNAMAGKEIRVHFPDGHTQDVTFDEAWTLSLKHLRLLYEPLSSDAELRANLLTVLWGPINYSAEHPHEAVEVEDWFNGLNKAVFEKGTYFD